MQSPEYGIQAFLWWDVDNKTAWRDADLVKDLGFGWIKQQFGWRDISGSRGGYDWFRTDGVVRIAEERGLKLLVRLDHQPQWAQADPSIFVNNGPPADPAYFGEFCAALATRFAGRIAAYEVWNEPNLAREWGDQPPDPAGYVALLKACYLAIKQADPQAIVISAGMAPTDWDDPTVSMPDMAFYQGLYDAGGAPYFDLLGAHAPGYMNPPELAPADAEADPNLLSRVWTFRHVEDIRDLMVANGDGAKQIAITEMGWTSDPIHPDYSWHAVSEAQKADYLVRAYDYAKANWSPWIGVMSAIYIADPQWTEADEQYWWAITHPTPPGDPPILLPAYEALKETEK
ncbi:MAG: cellulase family glycosylhydrolase [Anaerolineales bacterium]